MVWSLSIMGLMGTSTTKIGKHNSYGSLPTTEIINRLSCFHDEVVENSKRVVTISPIEEKKDSMTKQQAIKYTKEKYLSNYEKRIRTLCRS